jgi:uncharacterized protein YjbI with pentapeptide repeats
LEDVVMDETTLKNVVANHGAWLRLENGGARANLADAYLGGANLAGANLADANLADAYLAGANLARANLAGANLADANLAGAYLAGANLARANLAGANLAGADLAGARGNMREVKSMHIDTWSVAWTTAPDGIVTIQIGCQRHTRDKWSSFGDDRIAKMDSKALDWWRANRDFVLSTVDRFPAVPYGEPPQ